MIEIVSLTKRFGEHAAVEDLSLTVERGELVVLLGGSGCGKTTTLKMVNRLIEPTSGSVRIDARDTRETSGPELRRDIGYCFQQIGLFPHMTVEQNIAITPSLLGWDDARIRQRVEVLLELVELPPREFLDRMPDALSGGQQQRIGLARALAAEPAVMLLDEPFGALDPITRDRLQQSFQRIRQELELTALFVTHDMVEAMILGDRIAVLQEGRLVQVGTPGDLSRNPANDYVASLMETPRRHAAAVAGLRADG